MVGRGWREGWCSLSAWYRWPWHFSLRKLGSWWLKYLIGEVPLWPGYEPVWPEIGLAPKSRGPWDRLMLHPEAPVLQSAHRGRPSTHGAPGTFSMCCPTPALPVVTCVQAPLGAACSPYGEAAVAQVTELGEGGGGVYGIPPGSEGICG